MRAAGTGSRRRRRCRPTSSPRTAATYREAYRLLTGEPFAAYAARMEAGA